MCLVSKTKETKHPQNTLFRPIRGNKRGNIWGNIAKCYPERTKAGANRIKNKTHIKPHDGG